MTKGRLEAFSDGVLAIIITIMVLELGIPHEPELSALVPFVPVFISYIISFIYIGIYWNNHHHMLQAVKHVDGGVLWANLHLLFWLSLVPFTTAWMGEHPRAPWPAALYGVVLVLAGAAYQILSRRLIALHGKESVLSQAVGSDVKGNASVVIYLVAIALAFVSALFAYALYALVAAIWLVPDRRIEKRLAAR